MEYTTKETTITLYIIIILCMIIPIVSSATQVNINSAEGFQIDYLKFESVEKGQDFDLVVRVINVTNGLGISDASCNTLIQNKTGNSIISLDHSYAGSGYYNLTLNFTTTNQGEYAYHISCNNTALGGFASGIFFITESGELPTTATSILYFGLLLLLVFGLIFITYFGIISEKIFVKTFSWGFGYLFLVAISFVSWTMASDFLTFSPFLIEFLRWIFLVLMILFLPFMIILFAYGVYTMLTIKEIKDMMERGISIEEATERSKWKL